MSGFGRAVTMNHTHRRVLVRAVLSSVPGEAADDVTTSHMSHVLYNVGQAAGLCACW